MQSLRLLRAAAAISLGLLPALLHAQSTASLQGTITDATNAAVPNATLSIRNTETNEERTTRTEGSGIYSATSLLPGNYRIEITAPGMQTTVINGVVLQVGATVVQNVSLKVASTNTAVEINAAAPVVEAGTISVGGTIS